MLPIPEKTAAAIKDIVGPKGFLTAAGDIEPYLVEPRGAWRGKCDLVVRPATTREVAGVVGACHEAEVTMVPHGGRTGLVGGTIADGGIILSTERLDKIRALDRLNGTMTAESGVVLATIQAAADDADLLFPLSLGAEGSCRIGGNLSTNAGGVGVLRYGNARGLVLGLEVVLPDGRVWDGLVGLRKDNTGYDLKQLFIGAEGTLGIITACVLALHAKPRARVTAMIGLAQTPLIMEAFSRVRAVCGDRLTAFETFSRFCLDLCLEHIAGAADPFAARHAHYVLIELTSPRAGDDLRGDLEAVLFSAIEDGVIEDAIFADSDAQMKRLWHLRENVPEAQRLDGANIKHDVSVPVSRIAEFIASASARLEAVIPGVRIVAFGHIGDGNIHFNVSGPEGADAQAFLGETERCNRIVHDIVTEMGGSISAEHGIGLAKRGELLHYKSAVEIDLMRGLKKTFDPKNLMNPGKILDM